MTVTITSPGNNVYLSIAGLADGKHLAIGASVDVGSNRGYKIKPFVTGLVERGIDLRIFAKILCDGVVVYRP